MTFRNLAVFLAVCETGSFTAAGHRLYMSQPAVSLSVGELEKEYDTRLFDRLGKTLCLTESGRALEPFARQILQMEREAQKAARGEGGATLRLGCSITVANSLLAPLLKKLEQALPEVLVNVQVANSSGLQAQLLAGQLDLALIEGALADPRLAAQPFYTDELVLLCQNGHPFAGQALTLPQLLSQPLLLREKGSSSREFFDALLAKEELSAAPRWESVSTRALVNAVKEGFGVTVLPRLMVQAELSARLVSVFYLKDISLKRQYKLVCHQNKFLTPAMRTFAALCAEKNFPLQK